MAETRTTPGGTEYTDYVAAQEITNKEARSAFLALMAEHGQNAKRIWDEQQARDTAIAGGRGALTFTEGSINARSSDAAINNLLGATTSQTGAASLSHERELARIAAANAAYLEQVRGQVNIEDSVYGSGGGGGGGGGGRGGGGSGGGSLLDMLDDGGFGDRGEPSDNLFSYNLAQLNEAEADGFNLAVQTKGLELRAKLEEMANQGASREELTAALADLVEADDSLSRRQRAQLISTMDNYFGLTEAGARGSATVDLYFDEEDREHDMFSRKSDALQITPGQRGESLVARAQTALGQRNQALRAIENIQEQGGMAVNVFGQRAYDPAALEEQHQAQLTAANEVLLALAKQAEDDDLDLGFTQKDIEGAQPIRVATKRLDEIKREDAEKLDKGTDGSHERAERLRQERLSEINRRTTDEARRAEEARKRREAQAAAAAAEARRRAEEQVARKQAGTGIKAGAMEEARRREREQWIRRTYGDLFDDDFDDRRDEYLGYSDKELQYLADERVKRRQKETTGSRSRYF